MPILPHPDALIGALASVGHRLAGPTENTIGDVGAYEGRSLAELWPAPKRVPQVRIRRRWRVPGLVSEDLSFPSEYAPLEARFAERYDRDYRSNHTVWAKRLRPRGARGRPRLLYYHGYMQPETPIEEIAIVAQLAVRLGMEVIQIQPPYHGRRSPPAERVPGELFWTADVVRSIEALRQAMLDARSMLSWMLAERPGPVGVAGLSLGGVLSAGLTCLDERFAFSVPLIAHKDLEALVVDAPVLGRMRRELKAFGWGRAEFGACMRMIGWQDLESRIPPERIRLFAASRDGFFDPAVVRAMHERWGAPRIDWYPTSHMGFVPRFPEVVAKMRAFVDECGVTET
ncbi:MAG: alpha/beta hydrolase family protein [Myxococcales bacterium]|nr:alpha/beta hydrolase family protein [Myxococcales bacterium]